MALEKTLESLLDCKEIQPVHSEGDQPWDFFGRNDVKAVAYQAPPSMGFSRQEYWNGLPFPSPDLPDPGVEPGSPAL